MLTFLIQFNLSLFFSFLIGIGVGLALFTIGYLILVLSSMKSKKYIVETKVKDVNDEEVYEVIKETQEIFKDKNLKGAQSNIGYAKDLSVELVLSIAKKFFPESKHPLYELSINEVLMLGTYVSKRLDEVLDFKGLRILRKLKITNIVGFTEVKEKIESNSIVKATKKYKVMEALSATKKVINIVNPVYWARKFFINTTINMVIKKLCIVMIGVVGEETYKIYSKSVFDKEVELDTGVQELVDDIKADLENEQNEDIKEIEVNNENNTGEVNALLLEAPRETKEKKKFSLFHRKK